MAAPSGSICAKAPVLDSRQRKLHFCTRPRKEHTKRLFIRSKVPCSRPSVGIPTESQFLHASTTRLKNGHVAFRVSSEIHRRWKILQCTFKGLSTGGMKRQCTRKMISNLIDSRSKAIPYFWRWNAFAMPLFPIALI